MNKCPNCGNELISKVVGSTLLVHCSKCDFSIATTHLDPIFEDERIYEIYLSDGNRITRENYFLIQSLTNMNMPEVKKLFENTPYLLFKGGATEVKELKEKLDERNVKYYIKPDFHY